jgi:hypothetical protein
MSSLEKEMRTNPRPGWIHAIENNLTAELYNIKGDFYKQRISAATSMGLVNALPYRSRAARNEYASRLEKASDKIEILAISGYSMRQTYLNDFKTWAEKAQVRILLMHPDLYATEKSLEEGQSSNYRSNGIRGFLKATEDLWSNPDINFQVKIFTALPSITSYRIDNEILWGPYFVKELTGSDGRDAPEVSENLPVIIVNEKGNLFNRINSHFNSIWDSYSIPPEEVNYK